MTGNNQSALEAIDHDLFVDLPERVNALLLRTAQAMHPLTQTSKPAHVALAGLSRLRQDLNAILLLLQSGYPVQALALAAVTFETTYNLFYMGNDAAKAQKWLDHPHLTEKFWEISIRKRVEQAAESIGLSEDHVKAEYEYVYALMCDAKHGNPLLQKITGGSIVDDRYILGPQNYSEESEKRTAILTMLHCLRLDLSAVWIIHKFFLPNSREIAEEYEDIVERRNAVEYKLIPQ